MLKNETYIGVYSYYDVRVEGGAPAIVDKALFLEVAQRLKTKKNPQGRHRENGEYMLTGKLFCGHCGSPMVGVAGTGRHGETHNYYVCQKRRVDRACSKKNVVRDWLEQTVVDATLDVVLQDDVIEWVADQVMAFQDREGNSAQLLSLRDELAANQEAINNVMKAIEMGIITPTTKRRLEELEAEGSRLENAITVEEAAITHIERDFVVYWMEKFRGGDREDKAFRRKVIDTFVSAVYLWDNRIRIAFNYSGSRNTLDRGIVTEAAALAGPEGSYKLPYAPLKKGRHLAVPFSILDRRDSNYNRQWPGAIGSDQSADWSVPSSPESLRVPSIAALPLTKQGPAPRGWAFSCACYGQSRITASGRSPSHWR